MPEKVSIDDNEYYLWSLVLYHVAVGFTGCSKSSTYYPAMGR